MNCHDVGTREDISNEVIEYVISEINSKLKPFGK